MFSLVSVSVKNLSSLHSNHKITRRTDLLLFLGEYGAAGGSQATVGRGGCGSGGEKYYFIIFGILSLNHIEQFFNAQSKGLSFRFCQLIKLNTCSEIILIRKARLYCHFDQVRTLLRDRFDQESKAPVVPAQIALQRRQFAQNMDFVSAVHIRWAGARVQRISSDKLF